MGGVDLSLPATCFARSTVVPARVGGVDLSTGIREGELMALVPARVGGVDLSYSRNRTTDISSRSPPVWAGWI